MSLIEFLSAHWREVLTLTAEHLWLVVISLLLATAVGVPTGIWLSRAPRWRKPVLGVNSVIQTIPSLALFGLLLPLPWLGTRADRLAITALTLYALLPIVRNTYAGILNVDPAAREAAVGIGLTSRELLRHVELPLALPTILAGVRTAAVITVGVATIAAAIGAGGLGEFIFRGLAMVDNRVILAGAIPAALLALLADGAVGALEKALTRRRRLTPANPN
jgi:osmoprotectant transport system permease protein